MLLQLRAMETDFRLQFSFLSVSSILLSSWYLLSPVLQGQVQCLNRLLIGVLKTMQIRN